MPWFDKSEEEYDESSESSDDEDTNYAKEVQSFWHVQFSFQALKYKWEHILLSTNDFRRIWTELPDLTRRLNKISREFNTVLQMPNHNFIKQTFEERLIKCFTRRHKKRFEWLSRFEDSLKPFVEDINHFFYNYDSAELLNFLKVIKVKVEDATRQVKEFVSQNQEYEADSIRPTETNFVNACDKAIKYAEQFHKLWQASLQTTAYDKLFTSLGKTERIFWRIKKRFNPETVKPRYDDESPMNYYDKRGQMEYCKQWIQHLEEITSAYLELQETFDTLISVITDLTTKYLGDVMHTMAKLIDDVYNNTDTDDTNYNIFTLPDFMRQQNEKVLECARTVLDDPQNVEDTTKIHDKVQKFEKQFTNTSEVTQKFCGTWKKQITSLAETEPPDNVKLQNIGDRIQLKTRFARWHVYYDDVTRLASVHNGPLKAVYVVKVVKTLESINDDIAYAIQHYGNITDEGRQKLVDSVKTVVKIMTLFSEHFNQLKEQQLRKGNRPHTFIYLQDVDLLRSKYLEGFAIGESVIEGVIYWINKMWLVEATRLQQQLLKDGYQVFG